MNPMQITVEMLGRSIGCITALGRSRSVWTALTLIVVVAVVFVSR